MRIGIVGLGLGGATTAVALARRGCDITIFEQAAEIREVGAGVAIWASTTRLLRRMGMGETLERVGVRVREPCAYAASGKLLFKLDAEGSDGVPGYTFHRAELIQAFAEQIPPGSVRLGKRCVKAAQVGDQVQLDFADGTSEAFDIVLGADGIRSAVHDAVVPPSPPNFTNLVAYRGLVKSTPEIALEHNSVWVDGTKYLIVFPVSEKRLLNFVGVAPTDGTPEESWLMKGTPEDLAKEFEGWDPRAQRVLAAVTETFRWGLYNREPLPRIVNGRIALVGDAAHPMTPHAGMGFGQAIEDGFALGVLLAGCTAAEAPERLRLYEALRLPRTTMVQEVTRRNAQFMHVDFPLKPGESRPLSLHPTQELIDYDLEREAETMLQNARANA